MSASPTTAAAPGGPATATAATGAWRSLQARWAGLAPRERSGLSVAGLALAGLLLWLLALAPAWRTLQTVPPQLDAAAAQSRQMKALAAEAATLRAVAPVPLAQAQQALGAATGRLGDAAKLSLQGERAVVTLKAVRSEQLGAWLAEARAGARARVVEATLTQAQPGLYDGSLTLAVGSNP